MSTEQQEHGRLLFAQGQAAHAQGAFDDAMALFDEALTIVRPAGDRIVEGAALHFMGAIHRDQGRLQDALQCFEQALPIHREVGDAAGEAATLNGLATVHDGLERYEEAVEWYKQALTARRALGDQVGEGSTLDHLGLALRRLGRTEEALARYEEAVPILEAVGDGRRLGKTLDHLGTACALLGQTHEATEHYQRALEIQQAIGDGEGASNTLANLAQLNAELNRPEDVLENLQQANLISSEAQDEVSAEAAEDHFTRALALQKGGEAREAVALLERALQGFRQAHDQIRERDALGNLGNAYKVLGQPRAALRCCEQALLISETIGDRAAEGRIRHALGGIYLSLGRTQDALATYEQALSLVREAEDRWGEAAAITGLGLVSQRLGLYEPALESFERALAIFSELNVPNAVGDALNNRGLALEALNRFEEARESYAESVALAHETGNRAGAAFALGNLGLLLQRTGAPEEALRMCEDGQALLRGVDQPAGEIGLLIGIGMARRSLGQHTHAREHFLEGLRLCRDLGDRESEVGILHKLGEVERDMASPAEARSVFEDAIEIAEELRGLFVSEEHRADFLAVLNDLYADYVSLLVELGEHERALVAAEQGRGRVFLELLAEAQAEVREGVDPERRAEHQRLMAEIADLREQLMAARSAPEDERDSDAIDDLERAISDRELRLHTLEAQIRSENPRYAALTQLTAWTLDDIQDRLLDEHTALLEYVLSDRGSLLFCVLEHDFEVFELPPREQIEQQVRELRVAVLHGLRAYPHGHALYEALIAPAAHLIEGKDLLICADGALHYLPFALLLTEEPGAGGGDGDGGIEPGPERSAVAGSEPELLAEVKAALGARFDYATLPYLVHRHAISYAPSATVAGLVHEEAKEKERDYDAELAGFADPSGLAPGAGQAELEAALTHTRDRLKPLPKTAKEVQKLAELFDDDRVTLRTGAEATKAEVEALTSAEAGRRFRFFHIASHGLLDPEKPQFSGLVFTPGPGGDPFWRTFEIFNARIPSELVVLSACETGLGKLVSGEGIVGLTRAFLYAGAPTVCVSLWKVADESSPELMKAFYTAIVDGQPKARALQAAQRELVADELYAHPYWWAPFVVVGEGGL